MSESKVLSSVLGILVVLVLLATEFWILLPSSPFKRGTCVRELGHKAIERITGVADSGAIETAYHNFWGWQNQVYNKQQQELLIKVSCPEEE